MVGWTLDSAVTMAVAAAFTVSTLLLRLPMADSHGGTDGGGGRWFPVTGAGEVTAEEGVSGEMQSWIWKQRTDERENWKQK